ncbi:hypothetical protein MK489_24105 [Myxococcota bacterium]|nr:hypothetical protein [Myxococcota bacterium]
MVPMDGAEAQRIAEELNACIVSFDCERFEALLSPGALVWHNTDHQLMDAALSFRQSAELPHAIEEFEIRIERLIPTVSGYVQTFVMAGRVRETGRRFEASNCLIVECSDGRVTRIDEYIDPVLLEAFSQDRAS